MMLGLLFARVSSRHETSVYTEGTRTSRVEIAQRLEGGTIETFRQFGLLGAGLGTATQGVRHLLGTDLNIGWQEGGLAKLAIEVGLPGVMAILFLGWVILRLWLRLTAVGDVQGSSQFLRVILFALVVANGGSFLASAQAYSDAVLALLAGFFAGCLFATATLDEKPAATPAAVAASRVPVRDVPLPATR